MEGVSAFGYPTLHISLVPLKSILCSPYPMLTYNDSLVETGRMGRTLGRNVEREE